MSLERIADLISYIANKDTYRLTIQDCLNMDLDTFLYFEEKILTDMENRKKAAESGHQSAQKEINSLIQKGD